MLLIDGHARVEKGNKTVLKGQILKVAKIEYLGAEYSHAVKVVFVHAGKSKTFYARHPNRLWDEIVTLGDGTRGATIKVKPLRA